MSCTINIAGNNLSIDEVVQSYLKSPIQFDDMMPSVEYSNDFISGVPIRHQLESAEVLVAMMLRDINLFDIHEQTEKGRKQILTKNKIVKSIDNNKKILFEKWETAIKMADKKIADNDTKLIGKYSKSMMEKFDVIENLAMRVLINKGLFSVGKGDIDNLLNSLEENDFRNFDEDFQFERDLKDSMSQRLRYFLAQIESGRRTMNNIPLFMDMDEVYIAVRTILSGAYPDYNEMREKLLAEISHKPWLQEVVDRLDKDESIKNEFVSNMVSHPVTMLFLNFHTNKDGEVEWRITESNRNTGARVVMENWQDSVAQNKNLYYEDPKDGNHKIIGSNERVEGEDFFGSRIISDLMEKYEEIPATKANMQKFLNDIGITLSDAAVQYIEDHGFTVVNTEYTLESFMKYGDESHGISKLLQDLKILSVDNQAFENRNFFDTAMSGSLIKALAEIEYKTSKNVPLASFFSGGKSLASHVLNRYATSRVRKLVEDPKLREFLKTVPFSSNNILLSLLEDPILQKDFYLNYPDVSNIFAKKGNDPKELTELSPEEHVQFALTLHQNNGYLINVKGKGKFRSVKMLYLTMSDKKNKYIVSSPMEIINNYNYFFNNTLHPKVADYLVQYLIMPEYNRIIAEQTVEFRNISGYNEGRKKFFIFDELNNNENLFYTDETGRKLKPKEQLTEDDYQTMRDLVTQNVMDEFNLMSSKYGNIFETGMTSGYKNMLSNYGIKENMRMHDGTDAVHNPVDTSIMDYVVSSLINNMNVVQLISGDPAQFFKNDIETTWENYAKRLAKDNASGVEIDDTADDTLSQRNKYRVLFSEDIEEASEYLKHFKSLDSAEGYGEKEMDTTDGQAWISLKEWAHILFRKGDITEKEYKSLIVVYNTDSKIDPKLLKQIVNVFKPVIVADKRHTVNPLEQKVYIKMSAFPLIPELTAGTDLDNVRKTMREKDLAMNVFKSGAKIGAPIQLAKLFTDEEISEDSILELDREGFRLQQEIPDKDDNFVNRGTQFTKMLFGGIRHIDGIAELEEKYDSLYAELYAKKKADLEKEILDENGKIIFSKINELIKTELIERKYDSNTIAYFTKIVDEYGDENFAYPLWAQAQRNRIEPIINSLIDSRIRKTKFPGKSYVLASRAGFKTNVLTLEDYKKSGGEITFTPTYEFGKDLKPQVFNKDTNQGAQVIVPWNFRDDDGNLLDIKLYMKDGKIDFEKLPKELLEIQGFRIPTQGLNSMSAVEIVGFLPSGMTSLIIAPAEYVTQMGSDFDVDKLYTYQKHYTVIGKNIAVTTREDNEELGIINEILDIHNSILSNPDPTIQKAIVKKLSYGKFDEEDFFDKLSGPSGANKSKFIFPSKQMKNYIGASSAKKAVGIYSLASTFNTLVQDSSGNKELDILWGNDFLNLFGEEGFNNALRTFGKVQASNNLSSVQVADESSNRTKSDIISAIQSAAVDNENQRILERIGVTNDTVSIPVALAQLGFEEDVIAILLTMPEVQDNSALIFNSAILTNIIMSFLGGKAKETIDKNLANNENHYGNIPFKDKIKIEISKEKEKLANIVTAPIGEYQDVLQGKPIPNAEYYGFAALYQLHSFNDLGRKLSDYNRLLNLDSKGLAKSFLETIVFDTKFEQLLESNDPILPFIGDFVKSKEEGGLYKMDDDKWFRPKKIGAILYFNESKFVVDKLYTDPRFTLYKTKAFEKIRNEVLRIHFGKNIKDIGVGELLFFYKNYLDLLDSAMIRFMYSGIESLYPEGYTNFRLKKKKIENEVRVLKNGKSSKYNKFLQLLENQKNGQIMYRASKKTDNFSTEITTAFVDLFINDRTLPEINRSSREFALDLIRYNYLIDPFQKATNFSRFIPFEILSNLGLPEALRSFDMNDESSLGWNSQQISIFTRQFVQNHPTIAKDLSEEVEFESGAKVQKELPFVNSPGSSLNPNIPTMIRLGGVLYESDGINFVYLPILETEYDLNKDVITNSIVNPQMESDFYHKHFTPVKSKSRDYYKNQITNSINDGNLAKTLELISNNSETSSFRHLAQLLLQSDKLNDTLISFNKVPLGRTEYLPDFNIVTINRDAFRSRKMKDRETIILHELIHSNTKRAITLYNNPKTRDLLSPEQLSSIGKLKSLFDFFVNSLDAKERKNFLDRNTTNVKTDQREAVTAEEANILYASKNLEEFMAILPTSEILQNYLKKTAAGKTSLWEKIKDALIDILKAFGLVNPDTLVESAIDEIYNIIKTNEDIILPEDNTSRIFADIKDISPNNPLLDIC